MGLMGLYMFFASRTQYQLVGNLQYSERAFNQVEAAAATAEAWLTANPIDPAFESYSTTTRHLFPIGELAARNLNPRTLTWSNTNSIVADNGRYLIEQLAASVALPGADLSLGSQSATTCQQANLYQIHAQSDSVKGTTRMVSVTHANEACAN
jgi:Tfp pilus assembly protein PilX